MHQMVFRRFLLLSTSFLLFCFLISTVSIHKTFAQNIGSSGDDSDQTTTTFSGFSNLNLPDNFSHFFYVDELGLQLSSQLFPFESAINRSTYRLGPNDIITLDVRGSSSMLMRGMTVNSEGDIIVPTVGNINIAGLTIDSAETKLESRFNETYKKAIINLSLDKPRLFQIHVTGDVPDPGKYTFPAQTRISEVVNKLLKQRTREDQKKSETDRSFVTGGADQFGSGSSSPISISGADNSSQNTNDNSSKRTSTRSEPDRLLNRNYLSGEPYSLREIIIKHRSGKSDTADLISYYSTGKLSDNPYIRDGDRINLQKLSKWTPRISISGAVKSPIETEFKDSDSIPHLIKMGGGYASDADSSKVFIYRKFSQKIHKITIESTDLKGFDLKPNDRIVIPVNREQQNTQAARISGEVERPGKYPVMKGETTAYDLLQMAGSTTKEALPNGAYLTRSPAYNWPNDQQTAGEAQLNKNLLQRTASQNVEGMNYLNFEAAISAGRVPLDITNTAKLKSIKIHDGDRLHIPQDKHSVFVFGQVNKPGYYGYENTLSTDQYINRAGGYALPAQPHETFVIKAGSRSWYKPSNTEIQSGDMIFVNRMPLQRFAEKRNIELQVKQQRNDTIRLILTGVSTITGFITTYLIITRN